MTPLSAERVVELFDEGVDAIADLAAERTDRSWHKTVVGEWSAHELARHLLAVSDWYHEWLDAALDGVSAPPFPAKQLDGRNELAVLDLRDLEGPEAIERFVDRARRYADRLRRADAEGLWAAPYGFANGVSTVGGHAGIAAAEWHLHAWDLSAGSWCPSSPPELYLAVGHGMTATQPKWKQAITRRVVQRIAMREPWLDLLRRSGRSQSVS